MARSTTATCCLTLPLKLEKWQEDRLAKRFEIARQVYNTLLHAEIKRFQQFEQTPEYREIRERMGELNRKNAAERMEWNKLDSKRKALLKKNKFSSDDFTTEEALKKCYKNFIKNLGSQVAVHGIAPQVWSAFNNVFFEHKGNQVHFKKKGEITSVCGGSRSGKSGGVEIVFRGDYIEWTVQKGPEDRKKPKSLILPIKRKPGNAYEEDMLTKRVKYVRILRKPGKTKDRWYTQLVLEGQPTIKRNPITGEMVHPVGKGVVGLDIGPQTLAYTSATEANLVELADRVQNIEQVKRRLQRKMDRSRRATNPDNYNADGTIRRGVKLTRNKSKRYQRVQRELANVQRYQAEIRKMQHIALANHLLSLGDCFYIEKMEWAALARRAKKTEVSEKTGKFKKKKRFGKSIANKAPAMLTTILKQKCESLNLPGVLEIPTSVKASQYNHQSQTYTPKELKERWNDMPDGRRIQRDLYSAFLLQHYDPNTEQFDQASLETDYPQFVSLHDQTILRLSQLPKTLSSMGIRRSIS